jgi:CubicO group peptidase (beta-lactamase class C family)
MHQQAAMQVSLSSALKADMQLAHRFEYPYQVTGGKKGYGIGLGWDIEMWRTFKSNSSLIWRAGSTYGNSAFIALNGKLQKGFVLLANQDKGEAWSPETAGYAVVDEWYLQSEYGLAAAQQGGGARLRLGVCAVAMVLLAAVHLVLRCVMCMMCRAQLECRLRGCCCDTRAACLTCSEALLDGALHDA